VAEKPQVPVRGSEPRKTSSSELMLCPIYLGLGSALTYRLGGPRGKLGTREELSSGEDAASDPGGGSEVGRRDGL
jgi:hypothetical protein